jgi:hypothetical protein
MTAGATLDLSLISHTNAGKTTLARTLLGRDVGEVRDAPHVTAEATPYTLVDTAAGDALILWDTPGFGDSVRLAKRLRQQGNPIGWFLSEVWDRFRDRTFWLTQLAVRNVRDQADAVLYLVNAAEEPGDAGYLAPELAVLDWISKPVIVLLNQTGPPKGSADEAADAARWRDALAPWTGVREVLTLDAFARCWVQERTLFAAVLRALPEARRPLLQRLVDAWTARRMAQFDAAIAALAGPIARAAVDRVLLPADPLLAKLGRSLGVTRSPDEAPEAQAVREMSARLEADLQAGTAALIAVHGLEGRAAAEVLARLAGDVRTDAPVDEGKAAVMGGLVSGALTGLGADLASGGLTFGAGMLAGAVLGALGAAGVARGVNVARGKTERRCAGTTPSSTASSPRRCCATSRWPTTDAVAASGRSRVPAVLANWSPAPSPRGSRNWRGSGHCGSRQRPAPLDDRCARRSAPRPRALLDELYPGALAGTPADS